MMRHPVPIIQVSYLLALWLSTSHTSLCYLKYKIKLLSALVLLWGRNEIIDIKPPVHKAAHSTCSVNSCYKNCVASPLWLTYVNHTRRGWQSHLINDESEVQNAGTALARARRRGEAAPGLAGASAGSPRLSFSRVARPREPRDRWSSWVCFCFSYPFLPFPPKHPACPFKIDVVVSLDMCVPPPQEWGMALGHFLWAAMWWPRVTKSQQVGKSWPYTPKRKILLTNKELLFKITQKFHFPYTLCTNLSSHPEKPLFKRTDKPNLYLLLKVMKLNLRWLP